MGKYVTKEMKAKTYKSTGGQDMLVPAQSKYAVYWEDKNDERLVSIIPDFYKDPQGIAEGICKVLNENNKIILDLSI